MDEGHAIESIHVADQGSAIGTVRKALQRIVLYGCLPTETIVVLFPLGRDRSALNAGKVDLLTLVDTEVAKFGLDEVRFSTIDRFKGFGTGIVVLCDAGPGEPWSGPKLVRVGPSRAKSHLVTVRSEPKTS